MRQALLILDVQPGFAPPQWLTEGVQTLIGTMPSVISSEGDPKPFYTHLSHV
ncbi:nicotinamidase-related amidase [Pseudomonas sp. BT76 TE3572]|uniref:Nicotinamidase n=1 Tax=Pseudomonas mandelii PD30 TaxID=1419583 RepID=A0A059L1B0_9PSED|nr:hypothetical protein V466_16775 [Pseudomonas mandelii PD30]